MIMENETLEIGSGTVRALRCFNKKIHYASL